MLFFLVELIQHGLLHLRYGMLKYWFVSTDVLNNRLLFGNQFACGNDGFWLCGAGG
ncbi:MAG: hypothetical protein PHP57_04510 [Sideroxydans sp.]|nr:hypothetical protein [Sideroxydans sp.]